MNEQSILVINLEDRHCELERLYNTGLRKHVGPTYVITVRQLIKQGSKYHFLKPPKLVKKVRNRLRNGLRNFVAVSVAQFELCKI